jgi:ribonuclease BN (tRNA processing enzyme)
VKFFLFFFLLLSTLFAQKIEIEILGSGGPELDGRASSSYILWIDGEAKLLVDMGSGSMLGFEKSNAKLKTLEAVVLTHLHIDHSVDLPSFVKAGFFSSRGEVLEIVGPFGNESFPSISEYLLKLFGSDGAYKYMQDVLTPQSDSFQIIPLEVNSNTILTKKYKMFELQLINVHHGIVPSLALRINVDGKSIVISGDTNNKNENLSALTKNADLFIAHHAITSHSGKFAKDLHMEPSQIATIASQSTVKKVVLSHRMKRTLVHEKESLKIIKNVFNGEVIFAEDAMRLRL